MELERSFGVLLHPSSLPGPNGIGTLGSHAREFVDWLHSAGAAWWQVLPLGPTGYGDSPYQAVSTFAGNPYFIDADELVQAGWLKKQQLLSAPTGWVDYGWLYVQKWKMLRQAWLGFCKKASDKAQGQFGDFRYQEKFWLDDYALYKSLKDKYDNNPWTKWDQALVWRKPKALEKAREDLADDVDFHSWTQWLFYKQWSELKQYAKKRNIKIIGDIPIFVAHDSPEVWAQPGMFLLDDKGEPRVVAGVPPDYFSATGQLWGNPLYDWDAHREAGFSWWIQRLRTVLKTCDLVRIDHFRGFCAYWEVPAGAKTAVNGRWVDAPGEEFFEKVRQELGDVPVMAEDLGVITPEVEAFRDKLSFPGMKVLQFGFDGDEKNPFLPENYEPHGRYIVYPGTHDNATTLGWYRNLSLKTKKLVHDYLLSHNLVAEPDEKIPWSFIELAWRSQAVVAIATMQDILSLGNEARMNTPSVAGGNWCWRLGDSDLREELSRRLEDLATVTGRRA